MNAGQFKETHGHCSSRSSPTYQVWANMKDRCDNPRCHAYPSYGGRGITYDSRWAKFENFLEDMGVKPDGRTLDRIDNDRDYELSNCRWATPAEQGQNRSTTKLITFDGKTLSIAAWARYLSITPTALHSRLNKGWPLERALSRWTTR